jgi:hypothetical protein
MASMAKWEQRAREALKRGNLNEFKSMSGKLGQDTLRKLQKEFLKPAAKPVEEKKPTPKPVKKASPKPKTTRAPRKVANKTAPKKTTRRRKKTTSTD